MSCYICAIWLCSILQKTNINEYFFLRRIQQDPLLNIERLVCRSIKTFCNVFFFNLIFQQLLHLTFVEDITLCRAVNLIHRRNLKQLQAHFVPENLKRSFFVLRTIRYFIIIINYYYYYYFSVLFFVSANEEIP